MKLHSLWLALFMVLNAMADEPMALWPHGAPGPTTNLGPEIDISKPGEDLIAGRSIIRLRNVTNPTITVYPAPKDKNTGAAVVVCPGGGYEILALDLEGTEVCQWLNSIGVTGILLKYRVPSARPNQEKYMAPLQDAQRALSLTRSHAVEWKIDPKRIGILGFSAGGHLSAVASCRFDDRAYGATDEADRLSCRPDFAVIIYPGYLADQEHDDAVSAELTVTSNTPPTFLIQTEDDPVRVENSVAYFLALKKARVGAEMHLFASGGHGYGLRPSDKAVSGWPRLAEQWMRYNGILATK
jgi:acetyl esterase/lipase